MYNLNDTIVAISSPPFGARAIIRITGPETVKVCQQLFCTPINPKTSGITAGQIAIDAELKVDAKLYLFLAPHSYSGDDVAEIHLFANPAVTEAVVNNILKTITNHQIRMAGPGEFTARAYLNGKIDLAQAEAVNEIVVSSNTYQLAAAEKLLSGRLAETTAKVRSAIMDCLSLLEAGLDFSQEDVEFISKEQAIERLDEIKNRLEKLLSGSISYESIIDLPAVGIAGAPNAGKSSLLNKLLGQQRSIVSDQRKTTRDVLTGELLLAHCRCVLFDCAGLVIAPDNIIDELAQQAAIEAIRKSSMVVYCVDISKTDWSEDIAICQFIEPRIMVPVATKCDLLSEQQLAGRVASLNELFAVEFLALSVKTGMTIERLKDVVDKRLLAELVCRRSTFEVPHVSSVVLTARHKQAVTEVIENTSEAIKELKAGNDEVAAMMLRAAYQGLSDIEQQHVDEQILDRIFSRFCIGK